MTNNNVELEINLFEELDEADLEAVVGGGLIDGLLDTVTSANNAIGNGGTPTTGAVTVVTTTTQAATDYLNGVNGGLEGGLQAVNGGLTGLGNGL